MITPREGTRVSLRTSIQTRKQIHRRRDMKMIDVAGGKLKVSQIELLKKYVVHDLVFNQLQFSVTHTGMIDAGLTVNMKVENSVDHDGGILDYCRLRGITIQTIVGTTKPQRVRDICESDKVTLSREEWYEIYLAAGNILP